MSETTSSNAIAVVVEKRGELAIAAMASNAKAEVEARYVIARNNPRSVNTSRTTILESCKRPQFAEGARYRKPVGGGKTVDGMSIRFAEEAIKAMTNIFVDSSIVWEDDDKRVIRITVTDLESNVAYADDISVSKTVERRQLKEGQMAISERTNSTGQKVFLVAATEDDLANKVNSAKSKLIRNNGLRLVPQDILEEAEQMILDTLQRGGADPKAETKKICDSFAKIGVKPNELERLVGHSLETLSPKEIADLRGTFAALKDGETTWQEVIAQAEPKQPAKTGPAGGDDMFNASAAIDAAAKAKITDPFKDMEMLCKTDGVTYSQVLAFMKEKGLCKDAIVELQQVHDDTLRTVIGTWKTVLGKIKAQKV